MLAESTTKDNYLYQLLEIELEVNGDKICIKCNVLINGESEYMEHGEPYNNEDLDYIKDSIVDYFRNAWKYTKDEFELGGSDGHYNKNPDYLYE